MKIIASAGFILCFLTMFGQKEEYNPRILFLTPHTFTYDAAFEKDVREIEQNLKKYDLPAEELSKHPKNIQTTMKSISTYAAHADASGLVPLLIVEKMLFTMFRGERNFIVLADTLRAYGTANELAQIADKYDVQHIVYFPEVTLYHEGKTGMSTLKMNVYNKFTNSISLVYEDTEDWIVEEYDYPELSSDTSAQALLFNVCMSAGFRILETVYETNPIIVEKVKSYREEDARKLGGFDEIDFEFEEDIHKKSKFIVLANKYLNKPLAVKPIENIFTANRSPFSVKNIYQVIYNEDSTKFVAFVAEPMNASESSKSRVPDKVKKDCIAYGLISSKSVTDQRKPNDKTSEFKCSVIRGLKNENDWYLDQSNHKEFTSTSLEESQKIFFCNLYYWHFFETGSDKPSPLFWSSEETNEKSWLFARIEKPMGAEPYDYEGLSAWNKKSPKNTSFSYLTYVEANHIVREMETFENRFSAEVLQPFYSKYFNESRKPDANPLLIYTGQRDIVIHPVVFANESGKSVRYFVFVDSTKAVYEWTYFKDVKLDVNDLPTDFIKNQFNQLTAFHLEKYLIIRDQRFWDRYVLSLEGQAYKYLNPLR